jgi:hypothetical protein
VQSRARCSLLRCLLLRRQKSSHRGPTSAGVNVQSSPDLPHSFFHSGDAYSQLSDVFGVIQSFCIYALAVIADFQHDPLGVFGKANSCLRSLGMAQTIGEAFLNNSE